MPDEKAGSNARGWSAWLLPGLEVLCTMLVGALLAWLSNFLDTEETLKRVAGRNFMPLFSWHYDNTGQRAITVVTIDDGDLREYGLTWPVPPDFHGRLIQNIARYAPRAIFLDVVFLDDRPPAQVEALRKLVCEVAQSGVAVYFASYQRADLSSNVDRMLAQARFSRSADSPTDTAHRADAGEPCARPVRAQLDHDRLDQNAWIYPLNPPPAPGSDGRPRLPSSVAHTLYCRFESQHCPRDTTVPMALLWPTQAAETNLQIMVTLDGQGRHQPVCRGSRDWYENLPFSGFALELSARLMGEDSAGRAPLCPYNQVLPATALKRVGFTDEQLHDTIRGDYVFIGVNVAAANDQVLSPVHGRLPGVHAHAVALDNLITRNGDYLGGGSFEWPRPGAGWPTKATSFTIFCLVVIAVALGWFKRWERSSRELALQRVKAHLAELPPCPPAEHYRARFWARLLALGLGIALVAILITHAVGPWRLLCIAVVLLLVFLLSFGQLISSAARPYRRLIELRAFELLTLLCLSAGITVAGYWLFGQGPLVIVEYVGLTALTSLLGVGGWAAHHVHAMGKALASDDPVTSWKRHVLSEIAKPPAD